MFDMNQCKPGDRLITKGGDVLIYVQKQVTKQPYILKTSHEWYYTSRDAFGCNNDPDASIIGFADEHTA